MRTIATLMIGLAALHLSATDALAQRWSSVPSRGACFYQDANYRGNYFCFPLGADVGVIPGETNDQVSSIRLFGPVEVIVYKDGEFRGSSRRFTSSISNLGTTGWNDRISSFRVEERDYDSGNWGGGYGGGGWGGGHNPGGWGGGYGGAYGGSAHGGWGSDSGSKWTYQTAHGMVDTAFDRVFHRNPTAFEWNYWTNEMMRRDLSLLQLENEIARSGGARR